MFIRQCVTAVAIVCSTVLPLHAQGPTVAAAQSVLGRCSYETCAIRLERTFFSGRKINVGLESVSSSSMGLVGGGLVNAVNRVPLALDEAQRGRRNTVKAVIAGAIGTLALYYSIQGTRGIDPLQWDDSRVFGCLIVGSAAAMTGLVQTVYAERHFSRAVWLYNREIPR
jgi:hypothetical protein